MGILVGMERVSLEWPGKRVLANQTIAVNEGDRIGIVGRNGDGKTTVLDVIAGRLEPDEGRVVRRNGVTMGVLAQDDDLEDGDDVIHAIVGDLPEYEWASSPRVRSVLDALLDGIDRTAAVGTLSGGQRRRVDLARVLAGTWDVVLLDEPTNHLDLRAITWLATHLRDRWQQGAGALLVVTHDRWFLDEVCLGMWEVHDGRIDPFEGGYSAYVQQRVERERHAAVAESRRRNVLRKELAWLARGAQARSSKPKFRIEEARALVADVPQLRDPIELRRLAVARLGKQVIEMEGVGLSYGSSDGPGEDVIHDIDWLIGPGERIGILGENGAGKTTLLGLMTGRLEPTSGRVRIGASVRLGILDQRLEALAPYEAWTVAELLAHQRRHFVVDGKPMTPERMLENLGFETRELSTRVGELSGGQRRRLALMCVIIDEPNVLVLDEPGNDLDTDMLAVLEDLLDGWPGTLLLVTHDRSLMERVADDMYALLDGTIRHVPGGVDEFLLLVSEKGPDDAPPGLRASRSRPSEASPGTPDNPKHPSRARESDDGIESAENKAGVAKLSNQERREASRRLAAVTGMLERRQAVPDQIRARLAQVDPSDYEGLLRVQSELDEALAQISALEDEWLSLTEALGE